MSKEQIVEIATRIREWAERSNRRRKNPFSSDLCGMCAIAAAKLFTELKKAGINARLVANDDHCFVQVRDMIVDVTATQFGKKPVLAVRRHILERESDKIWWRPTYRFDSTKDLRTHQKRSGWPAYQTV